MTRELIVLLLQILAFTKAQEETVCKDGVQQVIEVPPTPPPFNCEDLEWPRDDKTFLITKADPEEVEFVYRERFTLTCKVCTRPGYNVTVTDLKWSKQEGELSPEVRVGVLDLTSRPAETSLIFSIPDEDDAGVYKCTPSATLTLELPPLVVPPESVPEEPEEEQNGQNNNSAVVPEVVPTVNATENTPTMPPVLIPQYETKVLETDRYIAYSVVKEGIQTTIPTI
ncbi:uncharacterized protein LOC134176432 [Corticium candelabrum]|uniref:uncharacterized protein LOC134176432 n=1 Tax=Corticium candelabrum TaxID=121492 RepID=UPI002E271E71|nr:uncharacterized protein LOC134176432 [Corticium candelabrum]